MKIFGIDLSAIACKIRREAFLGAFTLFLMITFKYLLVGDSFARAFGESVLIALLSVVVFITGNLIMWSWRCDPVMSKSCEKIMREANDNNCNKETFPNTYFINL